MPMAICRIFDGTIFGIIKKDVVHTASDFNFTIIAEVICSVPSSLGYLVKLTSQGKDNATRYACIAN